jgi:hypothetical protein
MTVTAWEKYIIPGYPYAYVSNSDHVFNHHIEQINKIAYSERAFVRGDFFVSRYADGDTYYAIMDIPSKQQDFEYGQLGIDIEKELLSGYAKRGSVAKSGVTNWPRLVDRFDLDIYAKGSFKKTQHWITRDFISDKGTSNIYAFPFGPRILKKYHGWTENQLFAAKVFENQAGEGITGTVSGFDMYSIWDGKGNRLGKADPNIAIDRSGLFPDNSVQAPISCTMCHAGGINPFDDDTIMAHIKGSPSFTVEELDFAEQLFFTYDLRHKKFDQHATSFKDAMTAIGLTDAKYLTSAGEPTALSFRRFSGSLTCTNVAWELGITPAKLEDKLKHSPDLSRELGLGDCTVGTVSRENYVHLFGKIVSTLNIGYQIKVGGSAYVPPTKKCEARYLNQSNRTIKFVVGGKEYRLDHGQSVTLGHDKSEVVSSLWYWGGRSWWTYNDSWTAAACKNHSFKWSGNRVTLFAD